MLSRVLAFRPASVLHRLSPRSGACPLSLRDVLAAATRAKLPSIEAESPDVIRAALVAAKVLHSAVGLTLPDGLQPEGWFDGVARIADEIAVALPVVLTAQVTLGGESAVAVEQGAREVWRLIEAGLTHLVIDSAAVSAEERGRVLAEVAAPLQERALGFDCAVALGEPGAGRRTVALLEELVRRGAPADALSVLCPAAPELDSARAQLGALDRLSEVVQGVPVLRRGPISTELLAAAVGSRIRGCADGGVVAAAAGRSAGRAQGQAGEPAPERAGAWGAEVDPAPQQDRRARWRDRAAAVLGPQAEQLEAQAFLAAADFIEALGAEQSAAEVVRGLERLSEDGA